MLAASRVSVSVKTRCRLPIAIFPVRSKKSTYIVFNFELITQNHKEFLICQNLMEIYVGNGYNMVTGFASLLYIK